MIVNDNSRVINELEASFTDDASHHLRSSHVYSTSQRWQLGSKIFFTTFILQKITILLYNSTTTEALAKISTDLESLNFLNVCSNKFKNYQILLNKINHKF